MTQETLHKELEEATPALLRIARELTWNKIPDTCKFILSEVKDSDKNFFEQDKLMIKENDGKTPVSLDELMPTLKKLYDDFYDISLEIYKTTSEVNIIDVRYYSIHALDPDYKQTEIKEPSILHCKVRIPPWIGDEKEKFDINWKHKKFMFRWKMFWLKYKTQK